MKQVLHIFAKDVRHLWGEIFLSVAITAAFAWIYPNQWLAAAMIWTGRHSAPYVSSYAPYSVEIMAKVLTGLVPVSWWLLISNLIHDERLIGDRQFWLTRPYEWKNLLAAKMLFLLGFLYLPLLIAQSYLLAVAGFSPLAFVPGLLFNLVLISCGFVLPLVVLATVTSNFARMTLVVLGVILLIALIVANSTRVNMEWIMLPGESGLFIALLIALCAAAVVSQYATRRTGVSILLLTALPIAYFSIGSFITHSQTLINSAYSIPATGNPAPVQLSYDPSAPLQPVAYVPRWPNEVGVEIPLEISGMANQSVVIPDAVSATIESPNGFRWDSTWQLIYAMKFTPDMKTARVGFAMPRPVYDKLKALPLNVRLTLLLTQAQVGAVTRISLPSHSFQVSDFGVCSPQASLADPDEISGISCLSALREPRLTQIQFGPHNAGCKSSPDHLDAGLADNTWQGSLDVSSAQFGIASVKFPFGTFSNTGSPDGNLHLCPGTPVIFSRYDLVRRAQAAVTIQGFQLPALTPGQLQVITNP
jgi:hypothetical protein